jgi:hypothetical protein
MQDATLRGMPAAWNRFAIITPVFGFRQDLEFRIQTGCEPHGTGSIITRAFIFITAFSFWSREKYLSV